MRGTTKRWAMAAGMAAAALSAGSARAANRVFEACDGRTAPGNRDGGMATPVSTDMPNETPTIVAGRVRGGGDLVAACTQALADPRLTAEMGLRRAHLLRARALARLAAGDAEGALGDVDAAVAAAQPLASDPLFARSMGVSLQLVRAAAVDLKGDHAAADALAAAAAGARPYSVAIQIAAALVRRHASDAAGGRAGDIFAGLLPIDPAARQAQFAAAMAAGRFADALAIYPRLAPKGPPPRPDDLPALLGPLSNGLDAAYAFAATGAPGQARALLADMRERVARATAPTPAPTSVPTPVPTPADRKGPAKAEALRAELVGRLAGPITAATEQRAAMIGARAALDEGKPAEALKALVGTSLPVSAAAVDLLTALRAGVSPAQRELAPDPAPLAARLAEQRRAEKLNVAQLRHAMPAPETSRVLAGYGKASSGFLSGLLPVVFSPDGFTAHDDPAAGTTTVEFTGRASSAPVVDELTLLRAADLARGAGRRGLLIVARSDYARTLNTYSGYGHALVASSPAGFKTVLTVRFVDPAALPPDLADERARVLDADRVYAALAPIYIRR